MGLLERLAKWIEFPYTAPYHCSNCESRVEELESFCPKCGEEIENSEPEMSVYYWDYM